MIDGRPGMKVWPLEPTTMFPSFEKIAMSIDGAPLPSLGPNS